MYNNKVVAAIKADMFGDKKTCTCYSQRLEQLEVDKIELQKFVHYKDLFNRLWTSSEALSGAVLALLGSTSLWPAGLLRLDKALVRFHKETDEIAKQAG